MQHHVDHASVGKHHNTFDELDDNFGREWELHEDWVAYRENAQRVRAQKELEERSQGIEEGEEEKNRKNALNCNAELANAQREVDYSNNLSKKVMHSDTERVRLLGEGYVENEGFNDKYTNMVQEQLDVRHQINECENVVRLWNKEMGLCKSTTERANDMNNTQREVVSKKNSNAGKVARQLKEDFVNQVALLVEEVKSVAATEKAQAAVAKQVADTIKMM